VLGPIVRAQIVEQRAHWCARRVVGVARDELVDLADLLRELGHPTRMAILQHVDAVGEASTRALGKPSAAPTSLRSGSAVVDTHAHAVEPFRRDDGRRQTQHPQIRSLNQGKPLPEGWPGGGLKQPPPIQDLLSRGCGQRATNAVGQPAL
jgi:hypothetical protein